MTTQNNQNREDPIVESAIPTPFVNQLLLKLGISVPHPSKAPFATNAMVFGVPFALIWGVLMIFALDQPWLSIAQFAILGGTMFGVWMAMYHRNN